MLLNFDIFDLELTFDIFYKDDTSLIITIQVTDINRF